MLTSSLADKLVKVEIKRLMIDFIKEIINPQCNSLLGTSQVLRFEFRSMSEKSVILLEKLSSSQPDNETVFRAAVSPSPFHVPELKIVGKRGEESPVGGAEEPIEEGGVCETEGGTEVYVEDEEVHVVCGVDELGVSGYESEGFTLSEILRRKKFTKKSVSEGVVDTIHLPQCEFLNLQHLPLTFLLEYLCWPVTEFF